MEQQEGSEAAGESARTKEAAAFVASSAAGRAAKRTPATDAHASAEPVSGAGKGHHNEHTAVGAAAGESALSAEAAEVGAAGGAGRGAKRAAATDARAARAPARPVRGAGTGQHETHTAAGAAAGESALSAEAEEAPAFVAAGGARKEAKRAAATDARATAGPVRGAGKGRRKKRAAVGAPAGKKSRATAGEPEDDPLDDRGGEEGEDPEVDEPLPDDKGARKMSWALRVVSLDGFITEQSVSAYPFYGDGEAEVGAEWHGTGREEAEEKHVRNGAEEMKLGSSRADLQQFDEHSSAVRAANEKLHDDHAAELQVLRTSTHDVHVVHCLRTTDGATLHLSPNTCEDFHLSTIYVHIVHLST